MCSRQLVPGEEFALLPEGLICGTHIKQQLHQPTPPLHDSKPGLYKEYIIIYTSLPILDTKTKSGLYTNSNTKSIN